MKFKTNKLQLLAMEYANRATEEEEIRKNDITEEYEDEIRKTIESGELLNITVRGQVRKGKSTVILAEASRINNTILIPKGYTTTPFGMHNIARDQQEASKIFRNPEIHHTIIAIDEFNVLEEGGENVTAEQALLQNFSDVQAARYIHKIIATPKAIVDANSDLYLEVIQADHKQHITHCHAYWNLFKGGLEVMQLIGYITIDVSHAIKNWTQHVQPLFYKPNKTTQDEKKIAHWRKKDWYVEYVVKKHEKMDLITKEGIFRPRLLDYADIVLTIEEQLRPLAKLGLKNMRGVTTNYVTKEFSQRKIPHTILGKNEITNEVMGILDLWTSHTDLKNKIIQNNKTYTQRKIPVDIFEHNKKQYDTALNEIKKAISLQLEEKRRYAHINKKYHQVMSR